MSLSLEAKLTEIRPYVKGFEAKNGYTVNWMRRTQRILNNFSTPDDPFASRYVSDATLQKLYYLDDVFRDVRSALSRPDGHFVKSHNQRKKQVFNDMYGFDLPIGIESKGYFVNGEAKRNNVQEKNGSIFYKYQVEGITKYYITFDPMLATQPDRKAREAYLQNLVDSIIPKHLKKTYRLLGSRGFEFGLPRGSIPNLLYDISGTNAGGIMQLANIYKQPDSDQYFARWLGKMVVYAWPPEFVTNGEVADEINRYNQELEQTKEEKRRARLKAARAKKTQYR